MGDVYVAVAAARIHRLDCVRMVEEGECIDADDGRNSWLLVVRPELWRRRNARNRWLRCTRPFVIHSTPPLGCRRGDVVHTGDPRVAWGGRERFERVPRALWPAGE